MICIYTVYPVILLQVGPKLLVLGDIARKHGLKSSLLERLQNHYKKIGEQATILQATLQTNHRCHVDILEFASQLFYNSSVRESPKSKKIKSHPDFPYSLVFICSSEKEIRNYEHNVNTDEAQLLLSTLHKILTRWQEADKNADVQNGICIVSSSRGQVSIFLPMLV